MVDSRVGVPKNVCGKYGVYVLKDCIGHGGNGKVYTVEIESESTKIPEANGYVLKILKPLDSFKSEKVKIIEERFRREADTVGTQLAGIDSIIPIWDSSYANAETEQPCQWYLMPKADHFNYKNYTIEERIEYMLQIAETLSAVHSQTFSHRDIKPSNMLLYNGRLCLTDFGLVWSDDFDTQLTGEEESIGPAAIRPPELEPPVNQDAAMFLKSDVYLFAKTMWIVLTGIKRGFYQRYSRSDDNMYLGTLIKSNFTLEPIHKILEESTFDDYDRRISITDCCKLLSLQRDVFLQKLPERELAQLRYSESFNRALQRTIPDEVVITNNGEINRILNELSMSSRIIVSEFGEKRELGSFVSIKQVKSDVYEIELQDNYEAMGCSKKYLYIRTNELHMGKKERCIIYTKKFINPKEYGEICNDFNYLSTINSGKFCIDGIYELNFIP